MKKSIIMVVLVASLFSCGNGDVKFHEEMNNVLNSVTEPTELANALLQLEQKYPDRPEPKAQLGIVQIMKQEIESAQIMLKNAESLITKKTSKETKYLIYAGLADVYERLGNVSESKEKAVQALDLEIEDSLGVALNLSRAQVSLGEKEDALSRYQSVLGTHQNFLTEKDYSNIIVLLTDKKSFAEAINVYLTKIEKLGYSEGDGLGLSSLYEKDSRYIKSLISASYELWRMLHEEKMTKEECSRRLLDVSNQMKPVLSGIDSDDFSAIIKAQMAIIEGSWSEALEIYIDLDLFQGDWFEQFFYHLANLMKEEKPDIESIKNYVVLEPAFRRSQNYYYYLWNILKKGDGKYTFSTIRNVLDKVVLFGINTRLAHKTQSEISRLVGLSEKDSSYLFPPQYVNSVLTSYLMIRDSNIVEPVKELLSLPNNPYTDDCIRVIAQYRNDSALANAFFMDEGERNNLYKQRIVDLFR